MSSLKWQTLRPDSILYRDESNRSLVEIDESAVRRFIEEVTEIVEAENASFKKLKSMKHE